MTRMVIHVGANKTGSTTLQRALFRGHEGLVYLGEDGVGYDGYRDIVNSLVGDDDLYYPEGDCKALFDRFLASTGGKTFLYSNEDLMTSRVPLLAARRLHELMPDADVMFVLRNQLTAIPSFYASHGAFLKPAPPSYFRRHVTLDDWLTFNFMFPKYGPLAGYDYNSFASMYAKLFTTGRLHFLLFEEFLADKPAFVRKLCDILQIDVDQATQLLGSSHERRRVTARLLAYNRFRTHFFWGYSFSRWLPGGRFLTERLHAFLQSGPPAKVQLTGDWKKRIVERYAEGNGKLGSTYGLPLADYGYPVV